MADPIYDKRDQYDKIAGALLAQAGEEVIAVYDAIGTGTGFIGLTNRRVIFQDNSFVGKRVALTSVPYNRIHSVSYVADKSMFGKFASSATISISVSGEQHEITFRGDDKAKHAHDVIVWYMLAGK